MKWKNIPENKDLNQYIGGSKLERNFITILQKSLKDSFDPLKTIHYDAEAKKKNVIKLLVDRCMSK